MEDFVPAAVSIFTAIIFNSLMFCTIIWLFKKSPFLLSCIPSYSFLLSTLVVIEEIIMVPRHSKTKQNQTITGVSPWLTKGDVFIGERRKKRRLFMRSVAPSIHLSHAHLNLKPNVVTVLCK